MTVYTSRDTRHVDLSPDGVVVTVMARSVSRAYDVRESLTNALLAFSLSYLFTGPPVKDTKEDPKKETTYVKHTHTRILSNVV